jgi:hypothetical protein
MKRVALAAALALGVLMVPTGATAQDTSQVSFVHTGSTGPVDLYVGPADASQADLVATNVAGGAIVDLGTLVAAKYRFLGCSAGGASAPSTESCIALGRPTTFDDDITIGADKVNEVVLGYTGRGVAGLMKFNIDTKCATGRVTIANVSRSDPAVATVDGAVLDDNLAPGKQAKQAVSPGGHNLGVSDGAALDITTGVDVPSQVNSITYVTGVPTFYGTMTHQVAMDCTGPPPTEATTPVSSDSAATAGAAASNSTAVNPRYAG